jgi:hypothetical protein
VLDVRYAPIATKLCIAAKCRDVPTADSCLTARWLLFDDQAFAFAITALFKVCDSLIEIFARLDGIGRVLTRHTRIQSQSHTME